MHNVLRGLTAKEARTASDAEDARLRGRTYPIPFEQVWQASLTLIDERLPRCSLAHADDREGHIEADGATLFRRRELRIRIDITLDADAQTRVEAAITVAGRGGDLGVAPRWIKRFFRHLDAALMRRPQPSDAARADR